MAFAQDTKLDSAGPNGCVCEPIPPPRGRPNAICFISLTDDLKEYPEVSKETNDALRTNIQSLLDDVNALIDSHNCSNPLTDHGKIGSEESLTVIKTTRESNLDHFIQALEVENLHTGHQYLVEMLVEDMEDQNLEKPPPEPPPQNHTKAMSLTLKQQQLSFIVEKGQLQEHYIIFGEKNNMCKSKEVFVTTIGTHKVTILEHLGTMQIKANGLMDSGVKCMIACLGRKIFNMLQVTGNWKMSEVLKLVLGSLSCGCKGEDHNGVKFFYIYLKDERSFDNLCKQIIEVARSCI